MTPRITMVTTFYPPYNFGGDGMGIQRLSAALVRRGFGVTVVHDADAYLTLSKSAPAPVDYGDGVKIISLKSPLGAWSNLATHQTGRPVMHAQRLHSLLSCENTDIAWFHNASLAGGPGVFAYGDSVKIYEAHEHWLICPTHVLWRYDKERCVDRKCLSCVLSYKRPPQLWRMTGMLERYGKHIDAFIAKSAFSRDKHHEFGFPFDMQVVPYFLPDEAPSAVDPAPAHDKPFFLFVGRLEKIKGVQDILPAFASADGPDLLVIGDGEYASELRAQGQSLPRVKFLGRKPADALSRYYRDAIALVTPSLCYETFGIVLIEAFRKGLPVIARNLGPFPEIIKTAKAGHLFDDEAGLRAAMEAMHTKPDQRAAMQRAAQSAFNAHWSEAAVMKRYLDVVHAAAFKRNHTRLADALKERIAA